MSGSSSPPSGGVVNDIADDGSYMRWAKKPWRHIGHFSREEAIQLLREKMVSQKRRMLMKDCVRIIYYCQVQRSSNCRYEMSICVPLDPNEKIRVDDFNTHTCDMISNRLRRRVLPQLEDFDRPIEKRSRVERQRVEKVRAERRMASSAAAAVAGIEDYPEGAGDYHEPDAATSLAMSLIPPQPAEEENSSAIFNELPQSSVWTAVEVDIVDLTKKPDGDYKFILNCTDQATHFSYACPLTDCSEEVVAQSLLDVVYTFGAPDDIQVNGSFVDREGILKMKFPSTNLISVPLKKNNQGVPVHRREAQIMKERLFAWMVENDCKGWASELKAMKYAHNSEWIEELGGTPMDLFYRRGTKRNLTFTEEISAEDLLNSVKYEVCE